MMEMMEKNQVAAKDKWKEENISYNYYQE